MVKPYYIKCVHRAKKTSVRKCFTKQLFLKVEQNSQGNICENITF